MSHPCATCSASFAHWSLATSLSCSLPPPGIFLKHGQHFQNKLELLELFHGDDVSPPIDIFGTLQLSSAAELELSHTPVMQNSALPPLDFFMGAMLEAFKLTVSQSQTKDILPLCEQLLRQIMWSSCWNPAQQQPSSEPCHGPGCWTPMSDAQTWDEIQQAFAAPAASIDCKESHFDSEWQTPPRSRTFAPHSTPEKTSALPGVNCNAEQRGLPLYACSTKNSFAAVSPDDEDSQSESEDDLAYCESVIDDCAPLGSHGHVSEQCKLGHSECDHSDAPPVLNSDDSDRTQTGSSNCIDNNLLTVQGSNGFDSEQYKPCNLKFDTQATMWPQYVCQRADHMPKPLDTTVPGVPPSFSPGPRFSATGSGSAPSPSPDPRSPASGSSSPDSGRLSPGRPDCRSFGGPGLHSSGRLGSDRSPAGPARVFWPGHFATSTATMPENDISGVCHDVLNPVVSSADHELASTIQHEEVEAYAHSLKEYFRPGPRAIEPKDDDDDDDDDDENATMPGNRDNQENIPAEVDAEKLSQADNHDDMHKMGPVGPGAIGGPPRGPITSNDDITRVQYEVTPYDSTFDESQSESDSEHSDIGPGSQWEEALNGPDMGPNTCSAFCLPPPENCFSSAAAAYNEADDDMSELYDEPEDYIKWNDACQGSFVWFPWLPKSLMCYMCASGPREGRSHEWCHLEFHFDTCCVDVYLPLAIAKRFICDCDESDEVLDDSLSELFHDGTFALRNFLPYFDYSTLRELFFG